MEKKKSNKRWIALSFFCFIVGVALWLPNFILQYGYGFWMLTFIINPLGILFGFLGRVKIGIIANIIMTFSFFIIMFVGYLIEAMFG
ncbi:hypothetical protein [Metabacillus malikii]|uniref:Vacuolar-type H+-ATPase subunit I/STV1 n=1 Tax=Metabacillus malikii TaxID=1504265 RepID=A0ABT9ZAF1_9BACI|nr:hypothetical protein [Metabacillus malikii]MDQ0229229.1 vacuolar-type H+-ATPase subunit I/STV1 [Metabacillus malikii]